MKDLLKMGIEGQYVAAKDLQEKVKDLDNLMLPFIANGIKFCLKLMGYKGMIPRKPYIEIPGKVKNQIENKLRDAKLI